VRGFSARFGRARKKARLGGGAGEIRTDDNTILSESLLHTYGSEVASQKSQAHTAKSHECSYISVAVAAELDLTRFLR